MKGIGLASAFRTLTILPFPGKESESPATALYWFVCVGAVLGLFAAIVGYVVQLMQNPLLSGAIITTTLAYLTRAFHLDGLADMCDGFGGGFTKERRLEIMKDSRTGVFGVVSVTLILLLKTIAYASLCEHNLYGMIFLVPVFSRFFIVVQTVLQPYAREGEGTASRLVRESKTRHLLVSFLQLAMCILIVISSFNPVLLFSLLAGLLATLTVAHISKKNIGGITGDVLGATAEISETLVAIASLTLFVTY